MATKEKKSKRQRREEMMARANRERQTQGQPRAAGPELTGPQGVGAPRVTGSDVPARGAAPQQGPGTKLPE